MNALKIGRWVVLGVLLVLLSTSVVSADIPDDAKWIVGDWRHTRVVRIDWSFTSLLDKAISAESETVTLIRNRPISKKFSLIRQDPASDEFRSQIFEIEESQTKGFMLIQWSEIGEHWIGELSGFREGGEEISGKVELNKVNDNQFTYKINDLLVDGVQKPDVSLTFVRQ